MAETDKSSDAGWAVVAAVLFGIPAILIAYLSDAWERAAEWMLEHQVLVPAGADPVLTVPDTGGAGVDGVRIAIALTTLAAIAIVLRVFPGR